MLTDVQYGNKDPWHARHYRDSVQKLNECVIDLNRKNPEFVILDGMRVGPGALGTEQVNWLCALLKQAAVNKGKVICFCHFALMVEWGKPLITDASEVIRTATETGTLIAWFSGHNHRGGYFFANGIHNVTIRGMVEANPNAYALIEIRPDGLQEIGIGTEPSRELPFGKLAK